MRVLITGNGKYGSWQIRGRQLGEALGATVRVDASLPLIRLHDLVVLVKHPGDALLERLHTARARVVWDVVDAWPQPEGNQWAEPQALAWFEEAVRRIAPSAIVGATQRMARDGARFGVPSRALAHHAREGQPPGELRQQVRTVGYEGHAKQLGQWSEVLQAECKRRGWQFVQNPAALRDVDIVVALRDAQGYAAQHWKSNVKLANAQACGVPVVCNRESGYLETASGAEQWADTPAELAAAFDALAPFDKRRDAVPRLRAAAPRLADIARDYRAWLETLYR